MIIFAFGVGVVSGAIVGALMMLFAQLRADPVPEAAGEPDTRIDA